MDLLASQPGDDAITGAEAFCLMFLLTFDI